MIKVFLVEDEIIVREGIKNNIEWKKEGFEFVGEASDGELAFPLIQKTEPDILITDIKMPFMDGLELSRLVKQEFPDIKIIILSGYDEFEYAREGIKIGIAEYLVKPISGSQLLESVKKVGEIVTDEKRRKRYMKNFEKEQEENARIAKGNLFRNLISGKRSISELLKEGRKLGIELTAPKYNLILFQYFFDDDNSECLQSRNAIGNLIEKIVEEKSGILLGEREMIGWMFLLKETEEESLEILEKSLLEELCDVAGLFPDVEYFGGVGKPISRLSELNKCYAKASQAFAYRYLKPHNQIVYGAKIECDDAEVVSRKKYSTLLKDAKKYIQNNFSNEEISLNMVAANVNLSPNHFSSIFRQETGQTFIEYLTFVRMERAKELLRSTAMRNIEIALEVGYKDAHYFSYLFKKTVGCTPKEFRAGE